MDLPLHRALMWDGGRGFFCCPFNNATSYGVNVGSGLGVGRGLAGIGAVGGVPGMKKPGSGSEVGDAAGATGAAGNVATGTGGGVG